MDVFNQQKLYPEYGSSILKHYSDLFESIFIALIPFYKIDGEILDKYPSKDEIFEHGRAVKWSEVVELTEMADIKELNAALRSSIGALKKEYERKELNTILMSTLKKNNIWAPDEGRFDIFSLRYIYHSLKILNKKNVVIVDEFYTEKREVDIDAIELPTFISSIKKPDYYIYSEDQKILFSMDWDSFFYLICSSKENIETMRKENPGLEGFYCNDDTVHEWSLGGGISGLPN